MGDEMVLKQLAQDREKWGTKWGTRPFLRCQDNFLLLMRIPDCIPNLPYAVLPRDRSVYNLSCPIVVVPSGRLAARGTHPA